LFKVPLGCFANTGIFGTIFTLPVAQDALVDGSDDEHPFKLHGIKQAEFRAFLGVLYPYDILLRTANVSEEEWISILKLSTMWEFSYARDLAIKELSGRAMDPITKVLLARQYSIPKWLLAAYHELVNRKELVSCDEAQQLGLNVAIQIFHIREKAISARVVCQKGWSDEEYNMPSGQSQLIGIDKEGIKTAFAEELKELTEV